MTIEQAERVVNLKKIARRVGGSVSIRETHPRSPYLNTVVVVGGNGLYTAFIEYDGSARVERHDGWHRSYNCP